MNQRDYKFWMVWNPQGRNPTVRHPSRADAENEAERLAQANPGQMFIVLESVSGRVVDNMKRVEFDMWQAPF